jgi:hypothetical protein
VRSTNVTTRSPIAKGGVGVGGRGARTGAAGFAAAVDPAAAVDVDVDLDVVDVVCGLEAVEFAPPHPATVTAIATPKTATPRIRDADGKDVADREGIALR